MKTKTKRASRAKVRRLRFHGPDGKTYERAQAVENDIASMLPLPHSERAAKASEAFNETLVYFIRRCDNKNERYYEVFVEEFNNRLIDLSGRYVRGFPREIAEDIVGRVRMEFLQLVLAERNSRKVEFLEVALAHAVKQRTIDIVRIYLHSPWSKQVDIEVAGEDDEDELRRIPDGRPGPEATLLDQENTALCKEKYDRALSLVTDRLDRELATLHWAEGWPVVSRNLDKVDLVTYSRLSEGQVKRRLTRAKNQMRAGFSE